MNVRKTCHGCLFWSPVDPTLDGGWRIFGTCQKPQQYHQLKKRVRHMIGWDDEKMREQLKLELKKAVVLTQSSDENETAFLRTSMDFGCNQWQGKEAGGPAEASMTGKT